MKAKFVYETQKFERGLNPNDALQVGRKDLRVERRLQKNADRYGYIKVEDKSHDAFDTTNWLDHLQPLVVWMRPDDNEEVVLLYDKEKGSYQVVGFYVDEDGTKDEMSTPNDYDDWYDGFYWEATMNPELLNESVDFERGQDPMDSMFGTERIRRRMETELRAFGEKYRANEFQIYEGREGEIEGMVSGIKKHPYTVFRIIYFPKSTQTYPGKEFPPKTYIGEVYRYQAWRKETDPVTRMTGSKNLKDIIDFFEKERPDFQV